VNSQSSMVSLHLAATSSISTVALPSSSSTKTTALVATKHLPAAAFVGIVIAALLLFSFFLILFCFMRKRRRLRLRSLNGGYTPIEPFPFLSIMNLRRREVGRRTRGEYGAGNVQARASIEKASSGIWNPIPERVGPDEPPSPPVASQPLHRRTSLASSGIWNPIPERVGPDEPPSPLVASQPLHRRTSLASESQETNNPSVAPTERQQELRERAESMRGGISALEAILLNENIPEQQRRDAQAELQQLRSTMSWVSWMEQSDWAKGLVDEPPPAYNTLLGRQTN
jgi:hypothetical protein